MPSYTKGYFWQDPLAQEAQELRDLVVAAAKGGRGREGRTPGGAGGAGHHTCGCRKFVDVLRLL